MSSPKVSSTGVQGNKVAFSIAGRSYTTGAVTPAQASTLTVQEADRLIASGQAVPDANSYLAQFPWTTPPK